MFFFLGARLRGNRNRVPMCALDLGKVRRAVKMVRYFPRESSSNQRIISFMEWDKGLRDFAFWGILLTWMMFFYMFSCLIIYSQQAFCTGLYRPVMGWWNDLKAQGSRYNYHPSLRMRPLLLGIMSLVPCKKLTWPMAKLSTFWDYIFSRESKVQTFISGSIG